MKLLITLQILYMIAHLLGDTIFLNSWMLNGKQRAIIWPIFIHALVHAILFTIVACTQIDWPYGLPVFFVVLITHFVCDYGKALLETNIAILKDMNRKPFWTALLIDQTLHQLVILYLTWVLPYQIYNIQP